MPISLPRFVLLLSVNNIDQIRVQKKAMRRVLLARRSTLPEEEKQYLDDALIKAFLHCPTYIKAKILLCYVSTVSEVNTYPILRDALSRGKIVAAPRCQRDHTLSFHEIIPHLPITAQLFEDTYGILAPSATAPIPALDATNTLCLTPALAYDKTGNRLGYGGGYYDRFFAQNPTIERIGLIPSRFLIEQIPTESTDFPVDYVLTEHDALVHS